VLETCATLQGHTPTTSNDSNDSSSGIDRWLSRVRNAEASLDAQESAAPARRRKVVIVGNSASGTADLLSALLEEPLEQVGSSPASGDKATSEQVGSALDEHRATASVSAASIGRVDSSASGALASRWLKDANVDLLEIIDPAIDADLIDTLYSADAILFVTDVYMLASRPHTQSASTSPSRTEDMDPVLRLLGHFASKPGTRLLVNHLAGNALLGAESSLSSASEPPSNAISSALERAIGTSTLKRLAAQCLDTGVASTDVEHAKASEAGLSEAASTGFIPISTPLAVQANAALRQALSTSHVQSVNNPWDTFAQMYNTSRIGAVKELVRQPLLSGTLRASQEVDSIIALRVQSALFVAQHAFEEAQTVVADAQEELSLAQGAAEVLDEQAQSGCEEEIERILGESKAVMEHDSEAQIDAGDATRIIAGPAVRQRAGDRSANGQGILTDSHRRLEYVLSRRLPWWKLPWKVDDVRAEVEAAIQNSFAKDAELKLVFEAGRMLSLAQKQYEQADKTLADLRAWRGRDSASTDAQSQEASRQPRPYFDSALFRNELQQCAPQEIAFLTLDTLSHPISQRRQQLLAPGGPVDLLMVRAQKTTFQASLFGISSVLFSTYATYLAPTFNLPYISAVAMQPSTGFALTALVWSFAAFRLQGSWGKWKRRFWREWDSLTHLLDADLEVSSLPLSKSSSSSEPSTLLHHSAILKTYFNSAFSPSPLQLQEG
jgi:hypothetical protein